MWPSDTDGDPPSDTVDAEEVYLLDCGDIRRCLYCGSAYGHKPHCRGADVHAECPFCFNIVGHKSSTCPGRYL